MRTIKGVTERLYVMLMAFSLAVLVLAAAGCGDGLEERRGAIETPAFDSTTAGRMIQDVQFVQSYGCFEVKSLFGQSGDAEDDRVGIGGVSPGSCKMRGIRIGWVNSNGTQTHGVYFGYDISAQVTTSVPVPVSLGQTICMQVWTNNGGATANMFARNVQTGVQWTGSKAKPANCTFMGEAASWAKERPVVGGALRPLANFGTAWVTDAWAWDSNGNKWGLGVLTTTVVTMKNGATTLATPGMYTGDPTHSQWPMTWNARL